MDYFFLLEGVTYFLGKEESVIGGRVFHMRGETCAYSLGRERWVIGGISNEKGGKAYSLEEGGQEYLMEGNNLVILLSPVSLKPPLRSRAAS